MMEPDQKTHLSNHRAQGFSIVEMSVAVLVILILAGFSVPQFFNMLHSSRLRGTVTDFAGLLQIQRIRAVDDDRFYSSYVLAANGNNPQEGFVDIYPQNINGSSGTGGASYTAGDPLVTISGEISPQAAATAPNTANLKQQLLPASSPVVPVDGNAAGTPVTFGPRGFPCTPTTVTGGTVCDSVGGLAAYWVFFENNVTQDWGAVTVTPAGRIARWHFTGGASGTWASF